MDAEGIVSAEWTDLDLVENNPRYHSVERNVFNFRSAAPVKHF
jgi:hypothetical protein